MSRAVNDVIASYPQPKAQLITEKWREMESSFTTKIIVLDDDPTGVQTVHNVPVYTDWSLETIDAIFQEECQLVFILTNSRAFTQSETERVHVNIAERIETISAKYRTPYLLVSRSDSTLRGHYPLETATLKATIEQKSGEKIDGEIILPFFKEGGRVTVDNIHYVQIGNEFIEAGKTEFAKDRTFGFTNSHLGKWIEEKTEGQYKSEQTTSITLNEIRAMSIDEMTEKLMKVENFNKVIVNALEEEDVTVFVLALIRALQNGKRFLFRTAATFTKVIGHIQSRPLLTKEELITEKTTHGGLVIIGSHVQKSTEQLEELKKLTHLHFIEFDSHLVLDQSKFRIEVDRVQLEARSMIKAGKTTVIYTRRERLDLGEGKKEEELKLSVAISKAVTSFVRHLQIRPKYLIAKGGITSSDIGTNGLLVKRAIVAGQIAPGIPVWQTGEESLFPHIPYIIFPGNVGERTTLKEIVAMLE